MASSVDFGGIFLNSRPIVFSEIKESLKELYITDSRPWLIGFSGGKDSTLVASLIFEVLLELPANLRIKPISVVCTDTRVEIPAIVEMIEGTLAKMQKRSNNEGLNVEVNLLRPPPEQSFWVNILGRGYPPPNRVFRWCTQRLKIDPVTTYVERTMKGGKWSEAILHLGARRNESAERSRNLANRETRNNLRRHVNLPNVWINNPIEYLTTEEVWAYLLQNPNPWGGDNKQLYRLYSNAAGGECPLVVDESTASCGNSRFGCWTCTVVERDKASEGLLESGDERMEQLIEFRKTLIEFRDPDNGWRDTRRMNGADGDGPLLMKGRKELLKRLLLLQEETGMVLVSDEELLLIQKYWKAARDPDDGRGVARIINKIKGVHMIDLKEVSRLQQLQEEVAAEKGICPDTLRRMLAKVEDYSESHKAMGLPDDLLNILKDAMKENELANKSD